MKKTLWYLTAFSLIISVSCKENPKIETKKIDFSGIDPSIRPGDNFFDHVNKSWYENAVIADDQVGVGSYRFLNIPQKKLLQNILEDLSSGDHSDGSLEQKVGDFYASGMDTARIEERGFEPIKPLLAEIESIEAVPQMMAFVGESIKSGSYSFLGPYIGADKENSSVNILHFAQTGTGLPDRDYYFRTDSSAIGIQNQYKTYLTRLFELSGHQDSRSMSEITYGIEKQLAESHKTRVERRDVRANYNKMSVDELNSKMPNIGWTELFDRWKAEVDSVDIAQLAYYEKLNEMIETVPLEEWKNYLKAHTLSAHADLLSKDFQEASFEYVKVLSGQSVQRSRSERMVQAVDRQLGFALGQLYVKEYFNEDAKKRALELVHNLEKAFEKRIENLEWMSDSTKVKAKEKLYAITEKIGYPDVWRSYEKVSIDREMYFENFVATRRNDHNYEFEKLNKAPDKEEWGTTPSTVTAYYNPALNEIVFPAGILQSPYFDLYADDAINYGGIGMVIGHELTHAFDDQGAQFDKDGNVKNWWTQEDYEKFKARTQLIVDQYGKFTVLDSVNLNGALTLGENTADNGGIAIAYDAFKMTEQGRDTVKIDGYTPDQRFFLSVARIWRVKVRDEFLRNYVATDPHSPPKWRVNGPLMNFTPFYEAFDIKEGDQNYRPPSERIKIW